jgi:long-subunit fatty acid transport protein
MYRPEERHALQLHSLFINNNFSDDEYRFGAEYSFDNTLFLRGGYDLAQETVADAYIYGFSAGAGLHYTFTGLDVTVDYAFRAVDFFQDNHVFAVRLGF